MSCKKERDYIKEFKEAQTTMNTLCERNKAKDVTSWKGGVGGLITTIDCPVCHKELPYTDGCFCKWCGQKLGYETMNALLGKG